MPKALDDYYRKRDFEITSEPRHRPGKRRSRQSSLLFVIQKHHARNLHYDFRLELNGTLKSWAVPKGPSLDPTVKRLAVHVEDHPLSYADFEGTIPKGQYGAGRVIVWDTGFWQPEGDPAEGYRQGKLKFTLHGSKLSGSWNLIRTRFKGSSDTQWLLIKEDDASARSSNEYDVLVAQPDSALQRRSRASASSSESSLKSSSRSLDASLAKVSFPSRTNTRTNTGKVKPLPQELQPQLATLVDHPPAGDWLYEIKFDGYRLLTRIHKNKVTLISRNGHDWTARLPHHAEALQSLNLKDSWLDGEIVVMKAGIPDFQALQNALDLDRNREIIYYLFDAPFLNGRDLREVGLEARRQQLQQALEPHSPELLRFSETFASESFRNLYDSACSLSLEGLIGKRADSPYRSRRSPDWIKLKCLQRQEFVIVGYTPPKGSRTGFGALLLGVYSERGSDRLLYCGKVGTGFNQRQLQDIHTRLRKWHRRTSPLASTDGVESGVQWLRPLQVCEVEFSQWTREGRIRHAVFVALREDKPAGDIIREQPLPAEEVETVKQADSERRQAGKPTRRTSTPRTKSSVSRVAGVTISSPDRVIDKASGTRKVELAAFYASIADWILPHLRGRPVSLVRAPEGIDGEQFFQKHATRMTIPHITHLDAELDPGHEPLMAVTSVGALAGTVQMGTVEYHTWGATTDRIDNPDRITLDLDPGVDLPWQTMVEATRLVMAVLDELALQYFLKTSGGKGMHIIIPIARHLDWDTTKAFARAISQFMAGQLPKRFTARMGPRNRVGKIFVDYLRNSRGASTVAAWSVRARPGLPVSVPIHHDELDRLTSSAEWTIATLWSRLDALKTDPWEGYSNRQRISRAMWKKLDAEPPP